MDFVLHMNGGPEFPSKTLTHFCPPRARCLQVREFGTEALSLFLEYEDLLTPMSQRKPPSLKKNPPSLEPGFAGHKASGDNGKGADSGASAGVMGAGKKTDSESLPVFLGLRAQLVFGVKPTPETIAFYWFAVM